MDIGDVRMLPQRQRDDLGLPWKDLWRRREAREPCAEEERQGGRIVWEDVGQDRHAPECLAGSRYPLELLVDAAQVQA